MAEQDTNSIPGLIRSVLEDTRELIREELALARAEIREEVATAQAVGVAFGSAAVAAMIGITLLCIAIGGAIAYFASWPAWAGYAIVAVLLLGGAFGVAVYGRSRLAHIRALPRTVETVKENLAWIQNKSGTR